MHWTVASRSRVDWYHFPYLPVVTNSENNPDGDPDRHQNLIICSLADCQHSLKISWKSVGKFLRKVANKQINNDENITFLAEVIIKYALRTFKYFLEYLNAGTQAVIVQQSAEYWQTTMYNYFSYGSADSHQTVEQPNNLQQVSL